MHLLDKLIFGFLIWTFCWGNLNAQKREFDKKNDLILGHFDCKTDVDDLHAAAAFEMLLSHPDHAGIKYHAVAGTYGTQEGLYVPPNDLFELAFAENWTDAHNNFAQAIVNLTPMVLSVIDNGGNIWITEAGQSDFSAFLIKNVLSKRPKIEAKKRFHIVQHSDWNEKVTSQELLAYAKAKATYHKIPDGNAADNGSPCFKTPGFIGWKTSLKDQRLLKIWTLAVKLGKEYNGVDGRYNNSAITEGGLDFSDISETCYILGIERLSGTEEFFRKYGR